MPAEAALHQPPRQIVQSPTEDERDKWNTDKEIVEECSRQGGTDAGKVDADLGTVQIWTRRKSMFLDGG